MIISTETAGGFTTNLAHWTAIPGLVLRITQIVGEEVLFVLNVPNPYASGNDYPGGNFGIQLDGVLQAPFAAFTYSDQAPGTPGRVPTTLCVAATLSGPVTATAVWNAIRGSTVHIDSPATLTMIR